MDSGVALPDGAWGECLWTARDLVVVPAVPVPTVEPTGSLPLFRWIRVAAEARDTP